MADKRFKPIKLTDKIIDAVMMKMRNSEQDKMLRLMNYLKFNPFASLTQTSLYLEIPRTTVFDLKYKLRKILKDLKP